MKKALNFDLDTKKYQMETGKKAPFAYNQIKKYLLCRKFEHRQGSGYVSIENMTDSSIFAMIQKMSIEFVWLKTCVKQIDVTNIGKQFSLIYAIKNTDI